MSFFGFGKNKIIDGFDISSMLQPSRPELPNYLECPKNPIMTLEMLNSVKEDKYITNNVVEYYDYVMSELKRSEKNLSIIFYSLRNSVMEDWDNDAKEWKRIGDSETPCIFQVNNNLYNIESNLMSDQKAEEEKKERSPKFKIIKNDDVILKVPSDLDTRDQWDKEPGVINLPFCEIKKKDISEIKYYFFNLYNIPKDVRKLFSD